MYKANIIDGVMYASLPNGTYDVDGVEHQFGYNQKAALKPDAVVRPVRVQDVPYKAVDGNGEEMDYGTYVVATDLAKIAWDNNPDDLDAEYHYRKMMKAWTVLRRPVKSYGDPLTFSVSQDIDTSNIRDLKHCTLAIQDLTGDTPVLVSFNRMAYLQEKLKPFLEKHSATVVSSSSGTEFDKLRINGKEEYMWGDRDTFKRMTCFKTIHRLDYEKELAALDTFIDGNIVRWKLNYALGKALDVNMLKIINDGLASIASKVYSLDVKIKSATAQRQLACDVQRLMKQVQDYAKEDV